MVAKCPLYHSLRRISWSTHLNNEFLFQVNSLSWILSQNIEKSPQRQIHVLQLKLHHSLVCVRVNCFKIVVSFCKSWNVYSHLSLSLSQVWGDVYMCKQKEEKVFPMWYFRSQPASHNERCMFWIRTWWYMYVLQLDRKSTILIQRFLKRRSRKNKLSTLFFVIPLSGCLWGRPCH